jgi:hypothetical protein
LLNKLGGVLCIILGIYLIVNHRRFGLEKAVSQQRRMLPMKKASPKELAICYLVGGIIFASVGLLVLFGIINFKG